MKKLLLLFFVLRSFAAFSQDTLVNYDNTIKLVKVLEVSIYEVKYKRFDNIDGPVYVQLKSDLKMIKFQNGTVQDFSSEKRPTTNFTPAYTPSSTDNSGDYFSNKYAHQDNLEVWGRGFRYKGSFMNERELYLFLNKTHDREINALVEKAKDAKAKQKIGFVTIGFGVGTMYFLLKSMRYASYTNAGTAKLNSKYLAYSGICALGTIACPVMSGVFRSKHANYNRQAINLYNQKF